MLRAISSRGAAKICASNTVFCSDFVASHCRSCSLDHALSSLVHVGLFRWNLRGILNNSWHFVEVRCAAELDSVGYDASRGPYAMCFLALVQVPVVKSTSHEDEQ